jgi:alpha-amylase
MVAIVRPHADGCVHELTHYKLAHNFADTLARRAEHYHDRMRSGEIHSSSGAPASIHDRVAFRTQLHADDLAVDVDPRAMFVDSWMPAEDAPVRAAYGMYETRASRLVLAGVAGPVAVEKQIELDDDELKVRYTLTGGGRSASRSGVWTVALDVAMPSCDGPGGTYVVDRVEAGGFETLVTGEHLSSIEMRDSELGGSLEIAASPAVRIDARPFYTASQSEAGFEKIMQTATLRLWWPVAITEGGSLALDVKLGVRKW